ncbi:Protein DETOXIFICATION 42 [Linum perenne]
MPCKSRETHQHYTQRVYSSSKMAEEGGADQRLSLPVVTADTSKKQWNNLPIFVFFRDARLVMKKDELGMEILRIAVPAAMALAADPVASLIDTIFIGHLGPVEIAAVGVAIAIFNQASKVSIFPLVSITTSFVAEEETVQRIINVIHHPPKPEVEEIAESKSQEQLHPEELEKGIINQEPTNTKIKPRNLDSKPQKQKRNIPSASTALVVGGFLGIFQAVFLIFAARPLLNIMGVESGSTMIIPALKYLTLRSFGSPAVLLSLAMQGVFRGLKDTKTPLYATIVGDLTNIILDPIFIFVCKLGVSGAAIAHVLSQYLIAVILLLRLMKMIDLLPPRLKDLQFSRFLKNGFLLLAKVIATTICVTFAASRATRLGSITMAAFQICLQVWLTSSLLSDGLAVAGQAIIATAFAEKDYHKATKAATRVLQMSVVAGLVLAGVVGAGLHFGDTIFSKDPNVLHIISIGIPVI